MAQYAYDKLDIEKDKHLGQRKSKAKEKRMSAMFYQEKKLAKYGCWKRRLDSLENYQ